MKRARILLFFIFSLTAVAQSKPAPISVSGNCNATASGTNIAVTVHCGDGLSKADAQRLADQYVELAKGINKGNVTASVLSGKLDAVKKELDQLRAAQTAPSQPICSGNVFTNCVAGDNYGPQTVNGYVPPPARTMTQANAEAAIALLKTAPKGSRVHFTYIGSTDDPEINAFFNQVAALFSMTDGVWQGAGRDTIGESNDNFNGAISHGEGLGCGVDNSSSGAGDIAQRALALAGFPCNNRIMGGSGQQMRFPRPGQPQPPPPPPIDFYVSVGTRITPPR